MSLLSCMKLGKNMKKQSVDEQEFTITWQIQLYADNPKQAAILALEIIRDSSSIATVFSVEDNYGNKIDIDVSE